MKFDFWFRKNKVEYNPIRREILKSYNKIRPFGKTKSFCFVPMTSLTISFRGEIYACSYNRSILLGKYPNQSLRDIWFGDKIKTLREHLLHNDLDYGCGHCKYFVDNKKFSNLKPLNFDKYAWKYKDEYPLVLEFEMSNTCNLECQMCIGEVSSTIRKNRDKLPPIHNPYDENFYSQLKEFIPHLQEAKFYGGEPFLIKEYYKIWEMIRELNPNLKMFVITNGTVWNNRVKKILYGGKFDVAISIDGMDKITLEKIRANVKKEVLLENINNFNQYVKNAGTSISLSFTVQQENWQEFPEIIRYANSLGAYLFISYLETPTKFSISSLSKKELHHIKNSLANFNFDNNTLFEKHNQNCFIDFLNFLEVNIQSKSKEYVEYRYGEKKENEIVEFHKKLKEHFIFDLEKQKAILNKLSSIEKLLKNNEERDFFYSSIGKAPFNQVIELIEYKTEEELITMFYDFFKTSTYIETKKS